MTTSTILFLAAAACGVLFGGLAVYQQMRDGAPLAAVRWTVPVVALVGCCAFGWLASVINSGVEGTTLYEIDAEGSGSEVPTAIEFDFAVEHPGAVHDVFVGPKTDVDVTAPAQVEVQLTDPDGRVLLDESATLEKRCDDEPARCTWDSYGKEFTPDRGGTFRLVVTLSTPDIPVLHVRIGDAQKTDGHRAPGY